MIRIVGIQRSDDPSSEFVVLQNQGSMRVNLRGHALLDPETMESPDRAPFAVVVQDDIDIPPGHYAVVRTGLGTSRWCHKTEGYHIYYSFLGKTESIWSQRPGRIVVLAPQHTYSDKAVEALFV